MSKMTQKELRDYNKKRKIFQICLLTDDIDKTVKAWVDIYKVGPWSISTFSNETMSDFKVGGKLVEEPFEFQIAISHIGDMEIEIIQPIKGPNIYFEYLNRKGNGLHHIKEYFPTDKIEEEVERYTDLGIPVTQTGWFAGQDVHYYLDTEKETGMVIELGNCPPIDLPEGFYRMYPQD